MNDLSLSVVIITCNEELNLPHLLENIKGFASDIVVVDSYSEDKTVDIARNYGARVFRRKFDNFSNQRNYALKELPYSTAWQLVLDADEVLSEELKSEIRDTILSEPDYDAFFIKRRFYWMGKWIKRGYYPCWLLRLGRTGKIKCDERGVNEHLVCLSKKVGQLQHDFVDRNHKSIREWLAKHNHYSDLEALRIVEDTNENYSFWANQYQRKRWLRVRVWNKLPIFTRPFVLLIYRLIVRGAIFDGRKAIVYHFLHAFIYRMMIDIKLYEHLKHRPLSTTVDKPKVVREFRRETDITKP